MAKFWDEGRIFRLGFAGSDWSDFVLLNATPAAGGRNEDTGARMAGGLSFDSAGNLVTGMFRHFCIAGALSKFSRLLVKATPDLASITATDIVAYAAGTTGTTGYDPRLRAFATAGEWAACCGFDALGSSLIFIDNTMNNTTTSYLRKLYSSNDGAGWTQNVLSSMTNPYYSVYSAKVTADYAMAGVIRSNTETTAPTTVTDSNGTFDTGIADSSFSSDFTYGASYANAYIDGSTPYTWTRQAVKHTRTRADRYLNINSWATNPGSGFKWQVTGYGPNGASTYARNQALFFNTGNGDANGFDAGYVGDPNASIAYWKNPSGAITTDVIVYGYLDQNGAVRIGRRQASANGGVASSSDIDGSSNLDPEASSRVTLLAGVTMGVNGIEMCHDHSTKSRVFLVTQVLDGYMRMFYSDDGGLTWSAEILVPGSTEIFNYANGAKDNRSRFFIASPDPSALYIMALTDAHPDAGGKPEWAVIKWTDPNS